jgi:hypothetical protein
VAHPLIAVNGLLETGERPALRLANRYCEAVLSAGGIPVAIPPIGTARDVERLLGSVDGLLLTGGDDFDMQRLGRARDASLGTAHAPEKQDFDVALAQAALAARIPVLGICYGMQLLALVEGGRAVPAPAGGSTGLADRTPAARSTPSRSSAAPGWVRCWGSSAWTSSRAITRPSPRRRLHGASARATPRV